MVHPPILSNVNPANSASKCVVLSSSRKGVPPAYTVDSVTLPVLSEARDLGVMFDTGLKFTSHIDSVVLKAFRICNLILRCFATRTVSKYTALYNILVTPIVTYCCSVWRPSSQLMLSKLERVQRRFLKRVQYRCNLPTEVQLPPLSDMFDKADFRFVKKLFNDGDIGKFFIVNDNPRRGIELNSITIARSSLINELFHWRVPRLSRGKSIL